MNLFAQLLRGLLLFALATTATAQVVTSTRLIAIDIKSKLMADALNDWAQQTNMQLMFPEKESTSKLIAPAVKGMFTPRAALDQLIAGTALTYTFVNPRTVSVQEGVRATVPKLGLETLRERERELEVLLAALNEEVVVPGSRLPLPRSVLGPQGAIDAPVPVTVFNREKIESLGGNSVGDLLRYLPQQSYVNAEDEITGAQFADLRGLGRDSTVVLINGRRTVASSVDIGFNGFDLNSVPLVAVDRIEVLSDSASAVYGTDAIAGVVNIVLKDSVATPEVELRYGTRNHGGEERRVSASVGHLGDRLHASLMVDYLSRGELLWRDIDRLRDQDYTRYGGRDFRTVAPSPGNVISRTTGNLPGLPSRFAAVPTEIGEGTTISDFMATAGQRNSLESVGQYASFTPTSSKQSAVALVDFALTPHANAFAELLYSSKSSLSHRSPASMVGALVPKNNPYNPFGVDVSADFQFGLPRREFIQNTEFYRAVAGLRGRVSAWNWEVSLLHADDDTTGHRRYYIDPVLANAALAQTDPVLALNPFTDGPAGSDSLLRSLLSSPADRYASTSTLASAAIRGPLFSLPAGDVEVAIGAELLKADVLYDADVHIDRGREVNSGFVEFRLPLVSSDMSVQGVDTAYFTLAGRHDQYSDFGSTFNPQFGLVWKAAENLVLRASYGRSFRAPSLFDLYLPRVVVTNVMIADPLRGGQLTPITAVAGGNANLRPAKGRSFAAGFSFSPRAMEGLRLTGSFWRIQMNDKVQALLLNLLAASESVLPSRVIRAEPTPADLAAGFPGALKLVDVSRINFGSLETRGADLSASYSIDSSVGRFKPSMAITRVDEYMKQDLPVLPPSDQVNVASIFGTIPRWRGVAGLTWERGMLGFGANVRYLPAYDDVDAQTDKRNGRELPGQIQFDLQSVVNLGNSSGKSSFGIADLKLTAGILNVADKAPPFSSSSVYGYDITQGDIRGRFFYANFSAEF